MAASAPAATPTIEGQVRDWRGQPLKNAEIRIEGREGPRFARITKTDGNGQYVCGNLGTGTYKVTLLVDSVTKACIANVAMQVGEITKLNFDLERGMAARPGEVGKHYVWVPVETGSALNGQWLEVDDNSKMSAGMKERFRSAGGNVLKRMQDVVTGVDN